MIKCEPVLMTFEEGEGRTKVSMILIKICKDILTLIYGGDKPHIGALAIGVPGLGEFTGKEQVSVSVFTVPGHRDYELVSKPANLFSSKTKGKTVVVAGVHIEKARKKEIREILRNTEILVEKACKHI